MDNDSEESKEVDAALLAQCTCGGVAGARTCTAQCAILSGCSAKEPGLSEALDFLTGKNDPVREAHRILDAAMKYIQGMGGTVPLSDDHIALLRKAIDWRKQAIGDSIKECPFCESSNIDETVAERTVTRTFEMDTIEKKYNVRANVCKDCKEGWLDYRAEEAELQALVKMLHDEVHRQRGIAKFYLAELETLQAEGRVPPA